VEKHENNRAEIQSILADIPRKLENIQRLSEVAIKFEELHRAANQVFLSIFVTLTAIIDKLSLDTTGKSPYPEEGVGQDADLKVDKVLSKLRGRGGEVNEAIEDLGKRVKEFQETANTCSITMIGRTDERTKRTHSIVQITDQRVQQVQIFAGRACQGVKQVQTLVGQTSDGVQAVQTQLGQVQDFQDELASKMGVIEENQRELKENQIQIQQGMQSIQALAANFYNMAYTLFAADGNVNPRNGTCKRPYLSSRNPTPTAEQQKRLIIFHRHPPHRLPPRRTLPRQSRTIPPPRQRLAGLPLTV